MSPDQLEAEKARIFPSWEQIAELRQQLTPGELCLARYLDEHLPAGWEIFVQPYMNGDRPDLVILHKDQGLMVFEVKDWTTDLYSMKIVPVLDPRTGLPRETKNNKPLMRRSTLTPLAATPQKANSYQQLPNP